MKNIVILSGYAQSGKTTFLNYVQNTYDFDVVSTSQVLHSFTSKLVEFFCNKSIDLTDKQTLWQIGERMISSRDLMIEMAENHVVPSFGRQAFANIVASQVDNTSNNVVYEAFNKREADLFLSKLEESNYQLSVITLESSHASPFVDGRDLLYGYFPFANNYTITNKRDDSFFTSIDSVIKRLV